MWWWCDVNTTWNFKLFYILTKSQLVDSRNTDTEEIKSLLDIWKSQPYIIYLNYNLKPIPFTRNQNKLQKLGTRFVGVSADKAASNVVVVWGKFYLEFQNFLLSKRCTWLNVNKSTVEIHCWAFQSPIFENCIRNPENTVLSQRPVSLFQF